MRFQRVNRDDAEAGFGSFENRNGATISGNYPICFTTTSGSNNGLEAVAPAASNVLTFAGFADADVEDANPGVYQAYGYRDSIRIFATGTSVTVAAGVAMGPAAGSDGVNSTGDIDTYGPTVSMEAIGAAVCSPGGYAKGFIRAM